MSSREGPAAIEKKCRLTVSHKSKCSSLRGLKASLKAFCVCLLFRNLAKMCDQAIQIASR